MTEAEYMALSMVMIYLMQLIHELNENGIDMIDKHLKILCVDNLGAIELAKLSSLRLRTKHT